MSIYNTLLAQYKNYSDEPPVPPTPGPDYSEPFYVEDISGSDNTVSIKKSGVSAPTLTIEKSLNGKTWETMGETSTTEITATVPANGKLYLRCSTNTWGNSSFYNKITCSSQFNIGGNIMSLLYGSYFTGEETTLPSGTTHTFRSLFYGVTTLVSAEKLLLPATTLVSTCYSYMFQGCSSLTTGPALPATTLTDFCYRSLFTNCTSLTTAPELPATTLAQSCYGYMFQGCSSLTTAPELPATTLVKSCYTSLFQNCTSLTVAPELPATTLANYCYESLFFGCTSLNYIKVGFTEWPNMAVSGASGYRATSSWTRIKENTTGTFVCPAALSQEFNASGNNTNGYSSISGYTNAIPYGWTVETF